MRFLLNVKGLARHVAGFQAAETEGGRGIKLVARLEKISPVVLGGLLGIIKTVPGNIFPAEINHPARGMIGFGLGVSGASDRLEGPMPFKGRGDRLAVNHPVLGLGSHWGQEATRQERENNQGFHGSP